MTASGPSALLVRAAALYVPMALAAALALHVRPGRRRAAGALLATAWNLPALLAVNAVAVRAGWWGFGGGSPAVAGMPADLWVGWALLWGAVPLLATTTRLVAAGATLVAADLVVMPLASPVVRLSGSWLVGEAVAVTVCLLPGLLLGRWTAAGERLAPRTFLQLVAFSGLVFFVVPSLAFSLTGEGWGPLLHRPRWHLVLAGTITAPVLAMAVQAVREFVACGGTPVPLDPPVALVSSGPYAYVANPMQLAGTILLATWGALLHSPTTLAAAGVAAAFSAGLASWSEEADLVRRFGDDWPRYRRQVRPWLPRWRPAVLHPGVVFVAATCAPCHQVGGFLSRRRSTDLEVRAAEGCPQAVLRITYQGGAGRATGVAAVGRSLEHVNLAWAAASWIGRLPLVEPVLQLITDAVVGTPGAVTPAPADAAVWDEAGGPPCGS